MREDKIGFAFAVFKRRYARRAHGAWRAMTVRQWSGCRVECRVECGGAYMGTRVRVYRFRTFLFLLDSRMVMVCMAYGCMAVGCALILLNEGDLLNFFVF